MFTAFLWWPYRSLFILELGASKELLGMLLMVETVSSILFQLPGARLGNLSRDIWVIIVVAAVSSFAARGVMSFMVIYGVEVVGLTKTQWGIIGTIVSVITTLLTTPSGILADRIGRKPLIIASRTLTSVSTLGYTFSENFTHMCITRGLGGIGSGLGGAMWGPSGRPLWRTSPLLRSGRKSWASLVQLAAS
jgi:MFS family permease